MKNLFPDNNITPKQHYLIHVPSQIKLQGPMVRHMCMRFESKHCFFKQWASKLNLKNVCKSLIRHNQILYIGTSIINKSNMSYLKEKARAFLGNDEYNTICYNRNYMAYQIEIPNLAQATELISVDNLVDFTPYYRFTHKDMVYVPMKYYLGDVIGLNKASSDVFSAMLDLDGCDASFLGTDLDTRTLSLRSPC
ncbi:hypothetical protein N1851_024793 [Merluccius polli]|uniref:Uncharacterized protein n=1 Tax=Merluccius polli TaxID=89951 RepID=A0AA47MEB5_MERPO|nr:hypothetical protein N1851_024793 [Merluccius polli]